MGQIHSVSDNSLSQMGIYQGIPKKSINLASWLCTNQSGNYNLWTLYLEGPFSGVDAKIVCPRAEPDVLDPRRPLEYDLEGYKVGRS